MSGENANIATAGSSRSRPRTNSALVNGAENQLKHKKKRPHHSNEWVVHTFFRLLDLCIVLDKKGVIDNERKQTLGTAAGVMGTAAVQRNQEKVGRSSPGATAGKSN